MTDARLAVQSEPPEYSRMTSAEDDPDSGRILMIETDTPIQLDISIKNLVKVERLSSDDFLHAGDQSRQSLAISESDLILVPADARSLLSSQVLNNAASRALAIVMLQEADTVETTSDWPSGVDTCLINDASAGARLLEFVRARREHKHCLIQLRIDTPQLQERLRGFLQMQAYSLERTEDLHAANENSATGNHQTLRIVEYTGDLESLIDDIRMRQSYANPEAYSLLVTGAIDDPDTRCALLDAGADDIVDLSRSDAELGVRVSRLFRRQTELRRRRVEAYRYPGSNAHNLSFLMSIGNKLYASAQRGTITAALAVITLKWELVTSAGSDIDETALVDEVIRCFQRKLRDTDVFAQTGDSEFVALVTCVGRNNVERVFSRLSREVEHMIEDKTGGKMRASLEIGATPELGITFDSMLHRARRALLKVESSDRSIVVI